MAQLATSRGKAGCGFQQVEKITETEKIDVESRKLEMKKEQVEASKIQQVKKTASKTICE